MADHLERRELVVYLWDDDGTQVHVSVDFNPESAKSLVKADLGDLVTPGVVLLAETCPPLEDNYGRLWTAQRAKLWGCVWLFERKNLI